MSTQHVSLTCQDVPAGARFFRDVLALPVRQRTPHVAEITMGGYLATLTDEPSAAPSAPEEEAPPPAPTQSRRGSGGPRPAMILKLEVDDVRATLDQVRARGGMVLLEPMLTDWGTESAYVAGPEDLIIEIFRPRPA